MDSIKAAIHSRNNIAMSGWAVVKRVALKYYHKTTVTGAKTLCFAGVRRGHGASPQARPLCLLPSLPRHAQEKLPPPTHDLPQRVSHIFILKPHSTTPRNQDSLP